MSSIIRYYRLFEVRILHEYYLLDRDNFSFYDLPKSQRDSLLLQRLEFGQYRIMRDLSIEPSKTCQEIIKNHRLKFLQTDTGFVVASPSRLKTQPDGSEKLMPEIPIAPDLDFNFIIKTKSPNFKNYSALPLRSSLPGSYLFTNDTSSQAGTDFVSLSQPVGPFQSGMLYYSGEISDHLGQLREATAETDDNNFWIDVEGSGFVNENDRRLYPNRFYYYPNKEELGKPLQFILKKFDEPEVIIKKIEIQAASPNGAWIDFTSSREAVASDSIPIEEGKYIMEFSGPMGSYNKMVFLFPELQPNDFGGINLKVNQTTGVYALFEQDGGIITPHPVFEIRLRSRRSFWCYESRLYGKKLKPVSVAEFFQDENNNNAQNAVMANRLITKIPQKMAWLPSRITDGTGAFEVFPQPLPSQLKTRKNGMGIAERPVGQLYSDIPISTISGKIEIVN